MTCTRLTTTVDASLLKRARSVRPETTASIVDEALAALPARYRSDEVGASYAAYDEHPLDEPDEGVTWHHSADLRQRRESRPAPWEVRWCESAEMTTLTSRLLCCVPHPDLHQRLGRRLVSTIRYSPRVDSATAGNTIREARRRAGLTQTQLAARAGVAQSVISAYESGHRQPAVPTSPPSSGPPATSYESTCGAQHNRLIG